MLGIRLPLNFDSPYKATSIIEFWRRWHMTLSRFLRDYLYIPLGGSRRGAAAALPQSDRDDAAGRPLARRRAGPSSSGAQCTGCCSRSTTDGARCAAAAGSNRAGSAQPSGRSARSLTFVAVFAAWVLFRADDLPSALQILRAMAGMNGLVVPLAWLADAADLARWAARAGYGGSLVLGWFPEHVRLLADGVPGGLVEETGAGVLLSKVQVLWIAALLFIVWFTPNTRQLMERADAIIEDRRAPTRPSALRWNLSASWALRHRGAAHRVVSQHGSRQRVPVFPVLSERMSPQRYLGLALGATLAATLGISVRELAHRSFRPQRCGRGDRRACNGARLRSGSPSGTRPLPSLPSSPPR